MNTPSHAQTTITMVPRRSSVRALIVWLIGVTLVSTLLIVPYAIASSFRLDRETVRLRDVVTGSFAQSEGWSRQIEVRLGGTLLGLARFVARFTDAPVELHQALRAARSAEVGVYQWRGADLESTRRMMSGGDGTVHLADRAWTRIVSVRDGDESVAVFTPSDADESGGTLKLCVVVLADEELIVVSVDVDPEPIADLVQPHLHEASEHLRAESRARQERTH